MQTYMQQIEALAEAHGVKLEAAFDEAGVERSTLRRSRKGLTHLRHDTACRVVDAISAIAARRQGPADPEAANAAA